MDTVKAEKASAMRRYRRIRRIGRLFCCLEACVAIMTISKSSAKLPTVVRLSGDLLRFATAVLLSPHFVFRLRNVIVLVLFTKSGNFSPSLTSTTSSAPVNAFLTPSGDLYDELLESCGRVSHSLAPPLPSGGNVVSEDKVVCVEMKKECRRTRSEKMEK
ncbi:hypothetical protein J5N97_022481 [Dioscorea zingiberensis]|uniref:Uncharacterized protein n=1 Tax=Dioscorea zingiberensis TaxID=325984 RepID=A0A9D5HAP8_9LILI|nr:hypothetical protein J5N97_022481 [Dioscorea zingiberensis]